MPLLRGYWRTSRASTDVRACLDGSLSSTGCVGGSGALCKPGLGVPYCSVCASRVRSNATANQRNASSSLLTGSVYYDQSSSQCLSCDERRDDTTFTVVVCSLALAIVWVGVLRREKPPTLLGYNVQALFRKVSAIFAILKQLVSFLQVRGPPRRGWACGDGCTHN